MKQIKKLVVFLFLTLLLIESAHPKKYLTKTGHAYFISQTDAIDIDAHNYQVAAILDTETGEFVVIVLIKAFEFSLATADKHFNETYMESDRYPKAVFRGKISDFTVFDLSKKGEYEAKAVGNLTIHGQTQSIEKTGKLIVKENTIHIDCDFEVLIDDYKIEVPKSVKERVAKKVQVEIEMSLSS
jgi:hypothetical protein